MSNMPRTYRSFHPHIESAYAAVFKWLDHRQETAGYRQMDFKRDIGLSLNQDSLKNSAFQYYSLFPTHYHKSTYTFENVIGLERLLDWLTHNQHVCIVDVGCGTGVGSVAFVGTILRLKNEGLLAHSVDVFCLGVDPNPYAIAIYSQLLEELKVRVVSAGINLEYRIELQGIPDAGLPIIRALTRKREQWQQPCLPHVLVMQVNIVSPLSKDHDARCQSHTVLENLGVSPSTFVDDCDDFGQIEALAYKQLFEEVSIDHMHVITVGTDHYLWDERVREMGQALDQVFGDKRHAVEKLGEEKQVVYFCNPPNSYWVENNVSQRYLSNFYVDVTTITNAELQEDVDWNRVTSEENLKLAWARARHHLLEESLVDEVEVRLFEANLDESIVRLRQQLIAYAEEIVRTDDRVFYKFPKSSSGTRPRALSRLEEEILSVAIIQQLGQKVVGLRGHSYAYRLARYSGGYDSEYLYQPWFMLYQKYIDDARHEAQKEENRECAAIVTDIKSFFTRIVQDRLVQLTSEQLSESERVRWLLRLLLSKEIDEHEVGRGIVQGNVGSGFYANIYLTSVDARFGPNNEWDVKFFRYVDDMTTIVPNPEHAGDVLSALRTELAELGTEDRPGLELNDDKTQVYYEVSEFLQATAPDERLEQLSEDTKQVVNALWIANQEYRIAFRKAYYETGEQWWYQIELYQRCLRAIGIFVTAPILSRRVYRYLFNQRRCQEDLKRENELALPPLPPDNNSEMIREWVVHFEEQNADWVKDRNDLHTEAVDLFRESWEGLQQPESNGPGYERRLERRMRFAVNRLAQLGYAEVSRKLVGILCKKPWLLREPARVIENLARQGFSDEIMALLARYSNETSPMNEYMRAVTLRGVRFLPTIDSRVWSELVIYATTGSLVESLAATETWLYLDHRCKHLIRDWHINAVKTALDSNPPPMNRLTKNYILIIGKHDPDNVKDVPVYDDYMIFSARDIAYEGNTESIFDYQEPEALRQNYYSGRRPDYEDYWDDLAVSS